METNDQPNRGRPSAYSDKIAETICGRLVDGESLRAICADPAMPARATVFRWLARNQEFRRSYALARQCYAEDFASSRRRDKLVDRWRENSTSPSTPSAFRRFIIAHWSKISALAHQIHDESVKSDG
jgi:hypothetical protein